MNMLIWFNIYRSYNTSSCKCYVLFCYFVVMLFVIFKRKATSAIRTETPVCNSRIIHFKDIIWINNSIILCLKCSPARKWSTMNFLTLLTMAVCTPSRWIFYFKTYFSTLTLSLCIRHKFF